MAHFTAGEGLQRFSLTMGARGRVVLPAPVRERFGLREGDRLVLVVEDDGTMQLAAWDYSLDLPRRPRTDRGASRPLR